MSCTAVLQQDGYIIRKDDNTEAAATSYYAENVSGPIPLDTNFRIRLHIQVTNACSVNNCVFQLQYSYDGGSWTTVNDSSSVVRSSASPNVADAATTTDQMTTGTGNFIGLTAYDEVDGAAGGTQLDLAASGHTEVEFCVQLRSADVAAGKIVQLRVSHANLASWTQVPSIPIAINLTPSVGQAALASENTINSEGFFLQPPVGTLSIEGGQATISQAQDIPIEPSVIEMDFVYIEPILIENIIRGPPVAELSIASDVPLASEGQFITPGAGESFFGIEVGGATILTPDTAILSIGANPPGQTSQTGSASLSLSDLQPAVIQNNPITPNVVGVSLASANGSAIQNNPIQPTVIALGISSDNSSILEDSPHPTPTTTLDIAGLAPTVFLQDERSPSTASLAIVEGVPSVLALEGAVFYPDTADLAISGGTPTLDETAHVSITPQTGSFVITPIAALVGTGQLSAPQTGALSLIGLNPGTVRSPNAELTTIQGAAPAVLQSDIRAVQAGSLSSGSDQQVLIQSALRSPSVGSLFLIGNAPSLSRSISPNAGSLTIVGYSSGSEARRPTVGDLALLSDAPSVSVDIKILPATGSIASSGQQSGIIQNNPRQPNTGEFYFGIGTPGSRTILVNTASLSISGQLTIVGRQSVPQPAAAALTLNGVAPTVIALTPNVLTPQTGQLYFGFAAAISPSITPATISLTLDGQNVFITRAVEPRTANLIIGQGAQPNPRLMPNPGWLTVQGFESTRVSVITPNAGTLALTISAPVLGQTVTIQPNTSSLSFGGNSPALIIPSGMSIQVGHGDLVLSSIRPVIDRGVQPTSGAIVLIGNRPSGIQSATTALNIEGESPTLNVTLNVVLTPQTGALDLLTHNAVILPSHLPSSGAISIAGLAPTILESLAPLEGQLSIQGQAPEISIDFRLEPITGTLDTTDQTAEIQENNPIIVQAGSLNATGLTPDILRGDVHQPQPSELEIEGSFPSQDAIFQPKTAALSITDRNSTLDFTFAPRTAQLALLTNYPGQVEHIPIQPGTGSLTLTENRPETRFEDLWRIPGTAELEFELEPPEIRITFEWITLEFAEESMQSRIQIVSEQLIALTTVENESMVTIESTEEEIVK